MKFYINMPYYKINKWIGNINKQNIKDAEYTSFDKASVFDNKEDAIDAIEKMCKRWPNLHMNGKNDYNKLQILSEDEVLIQEIIS